MQDTDELEWRQVTHLSVRHVEKHAALRGDSFTHGIDCSCGSTSGQAGEYKYVQRYLSQPIWHRAYENWNKQCPIEHQTHT